LKLTTRSWGEEGRPLAVLVHGVSSSSRTWWQVGPWFAERGWHAVAVDLRGHGDSPRAAHGLTLDDLTGDLRETVLELLGPWERMDVLLCHSLGALAALKLCGQHVDLAGRLVLEEPPGSENSGFDEVARMVNQTSPEPEKPRRKRSVSSWRRIPRGPKRTPRITSPACGTATPNRSPRCCETACVTTCRP
jgi:pimeloyl-ACP methyl ester carboxylesterase